MRASGPLRTNNGDATLSILRAGLALELLPEFFVRADLAAGTLEAVLTDWSLPAAGLHWVTPTRALRPKRVGDRSPIIGFPQEGAECSISANRRLPRYLFRMDSRANSG